jgi:hypothetical protein
MFYDIKVERVQQFEFSVEADSQKEAERLGRERFVEERFKTFAATTEDVIVQARAVSMEITKPLSNKAFMLRLVR